MTNKEYIETARADHQHESEIEIDDHAAVARGGDPGAYVQAWIWISNLDDEEKERGSENDEDKDKDNPSWPSQHEMLNIIRECITDSGDDSKQFMRKRLTAINLLCQTILTRVT